MDSVRLGLWGSRNKWKALINFFIKFIFETAKDSTASRSYEELKRLYPSYRCKYFLSSFSSKLSNSSVHHTSPRSFNLNTMFIPLALVSGLQSCMLRLLNRAFRQIFYYTLFMPFEFLSFLFRQFKTLPIPQITIHPDSKLS